jgi:pseudouridine-5'-phosphate glycosidase
MLMTRKSRQRSFVRHINNPFLSTSLISPSPQVTHWQIGMTNGALFGVPIPERYEAMGEALQEAVEVALVEADQNGMNERGKEVTPWLLRRIGELTNGSSLPAVSSNLAWRLIVSPHPNQILHLLRTLRSWVRIIGLSMKEMFKDNPSFRWSDRR